MGRVLWVSVVLAACALALPCAASAEPVVSLGPTAGPPSAVTDGAGTLHAVWHTYEHLGGPDMLSYCLAPAVGAPDHPSAAAFVGCEHDAVRLAHPERQGIDDGRAEPARLVAPVHEALALWTAQLVPASRPRW